MLLSYRVPREPSAPRIAVWRKLKRLGVAQLSDGLVGLPDDARTREHLEWIAQEVREAGGQAGVWLAEPTDPAFLTRKAAVPRAWNVEQNLQNDVDFRQARSTLQ